MPSIMCHCAGCKFWDLRYADTVGVALEDQTVWGACCFKSPEIDHGSDDDEAGTKPGIWPRTEAGEFCGAFQCAVRYAMDKRIEILSEWQGVSTECRDRFSVYVNGKLTPQPSPSPAASAEPACESPEARPSERPSAD